MCIAKELAGRGAGYKVVWIAGREAGKRLPPGMAHVGKGLLSQAYALATSGVWIDANTKPYGVLKRKNQLYIQTWHASYGLKRYGLDFPDRSELLSIRGDARYVVTPHPTYDAFKMQDMEKETARSLLKIQDDTLMLLFFGFVREYKGLKYLLKAMPYIKEKMPTVQLWVVGDFGEDKEGYLELIEKEDLADNVVTVEGYIPDREVEKYFAATDLVVLPYISATQSGIVQIAYGFEKPVVVTDAGGLPDVVEDGKTGYIVHKENEQEIAEAVLKFSAVHEDWSRNIRENAAEFSWETMVGRIEKLAGL